MNSTRVIIILFSLCHFLLFFSSTIFLAYLAPFLESRAVSSSHIGLLVGLPSFMMLPTVALFGFISDRFSPKRLVQFGALSFAVYAFGISHATHLSAFFLLQVLGGFSYAVCLVTLNSLYMKHLSLSNRGRKVGIFLAAAYIGLGTGPLLGGWLIGLENLEVVFRLAALSSFLFFLLALMLKDYPIQSFILTDYAQDLRGKTALVVTFCLFAEGIHVGAEHTSYTLLMRHQIGMTAAEIGLFYFLIALMLTAVATIVGHRADRGVKKIGAFLALGTFLSGVFQILTGFAPSIQVLLVLRLLHAIGDALIVWTTAYLISLIFPDKRMGGNYGFAQGINRMGTAMGAFVFGIAMGIGGYSLPFILSGTLQILIAAFLFTQRHALELSHHNFAVPFTEGQVEFEQQPT